MSQRKEGKRETFARTNNTERKIRERRKEERAHKGIIVDLSGESQGGREMIWGVNQGLGHSRVALSVAE